MEFVPTVISFEVPFPEDPPAPDPLPPGYTELEPNRITNATYSPAVTGISSSFSSNTVTLNCNVNGDLVFPKSITWTNPNMSQGHMVGGPSLLPAGAALNKFIAPNPQIIEVKITVHFLRGDDNTEHTLWVRYNWATSNAALKAVAGQGIA
jgi:hypothetical protein